MSDPIIPRKPGKGKSDNKPKPLPLVTAACPDCSQNSGIPYCWNGQLAWLTPPNPGGG